MLFCLLSGTYFFERKGINAIPETAWCRPIRKYMSEMCITNIAGCFHSYHPKAIVLMICDIFNRYRLAEGRPARTAVEFSG